METDPRWVDIASKTIEEILIDHAWCEQKAASSGISLIVMFPEKAEMVAQVSQIVAEEWSHFERVLQELNIRGYSLGPARRDEYVIRLSALEKKGGSRDHQLVEKLLQSALIEARSCERFKLLFEGLEDAALKRFYYDFMVSEAGHYVAFVEMAKKYLPEKQVKNRLAELLEQEAGIMQTLQWRSDRVH